MKKKILASALLLSAFCVMQTNAEEAREDAGGYAVYVDGALFSCDENGTGTRLGPGYTGWVKDGEDFLYKENGVWFTDGWKEISGAWYYFVDQKMQTGVLNVNGQIYYLDESGAMIHDTVMAIDGVNYEFDSSGAGTRLSSEIAESGPVDVSWFDDAIFVGDSVSLWLPYYGGDAGLGGAAFYCAGNFGIEHALESVSGTSLHPSYQGVKMKAEDAVTASGAKKVYLFLGMNDIAYGVNKATADYCTLIGNILAASPDAQIFVQSVTPMTKGSSRADAKLNNSTISAFNETMREYCSQNGWYYLDVASAFADEDGYMRDSLCSEPTGMGIHITYSAAGNWVTYLRTHTPG